MDGVWLITWGWEVLRVRGFGVSKEYLSVSVLLAVGQTE